LKAGETKRVESTQGIMSVINPGLPIHGLLHYKE
jgi:hypothetical protein